MAARRSYGTGSLIVRVDRGGREAWYGKWRANGRQVMRRIGPRRGGAVRDGYTRPQAEAELRRLIAATQVAPAIGELLTVEEVGDRYRAQAERRGRKRSTLKTSRARCGCISPRSSALDRSRRSSRRRCSTSWRCWPVAEVDPERDRHAVGPVQVREGTAAQVGVRESVRRPRASGGARVGGDPVPDARSGRRAGGQRPRGPVPGARPCDVPHRRDDRPAARRAARASLAGRGLACGAYPCPAELGPR